MRDGLAITQQTLKNSEGTVFPTYSRIPGTGATDSQGPFEIRPGLVCHKRKCIIMVKSVITEGDFSFLPPVFFFFFLCLVQSMKARGSILLFSRSSRHTLHTLYWPCMALFNRASVRVDIFLYFFFCYFQFENGFCYFFFSKDEECAF